MKEVLLNMTATAKLDGETDLNGLCNKILNELRSINVDISKDDILVAQSWSDFINEIPDENVEGFNDSCKMFLDNEWIQEGGIAPHRIAFDGIETSNPREYATQAYIAYTSHFLNDPTDFDFVATLQKMIGEVLEDILYSRE